MNIMGSRVLGRETAWNPGGEVWEWKRKCCRDLLLEAS